MGQRPCPLTAPRGVVGGRRGPARGRARDRARGRMRGRARGGHVPAGMWPRTGDAARRLGPVAGTRTRNGNVSQGTRLRLRHDARHQLVRVVAPATRLGGAHELGESSVDRGGADFTLTSTTSAVAAAETSVASVGRTVRGTPSSADTISPPTSSSITRVRPISVTSAPPTASMPPTQQPTAPAPNTANGAVTSSRYRTFAHPGARAGGAPRAGVGVLHSKLCWVRRILGNRQSPAAAYRLGIRGRV